MDLQTDKLFDDLMKCSIPDQLVIKNGNQTMKSISWPEIFNFIGSKHWHQFNNKQIWSNHLESLIEHLHECAHICLEQAISRNYSKKECIIAYYTGLLHDIGKPGTFQNSKEKVSFNGHGIVGGAIISNLWHESIEQIIGITKDDWAVISTCADVHMCSYFEKQITNDHCKFCLNILPDCVKRMLYVLRYGDLLSIKPSSPEYVITKLQLDEKESIYTDNVIPPLQKRGFLILIQGGSSAGKTKFSEKISKFFQNPVIVNRDEYIIKYVQDEITKKNIDVITPEIYREYYNLYNKSENKEIVNHMMRNTIEQVLMKGEVCIVDTIATMHDAITSIIPDCALHAFRMSIWINRNQLITDSDSKRLGIDLKKQIEFYGNVDIFNPLQFTNIKWNKVKTITEDFKSDTKIYPYLSITINWNYDKLFIIEHIINQLSSLTNSCENFDDKNLLELIKIKGNSVIQFFKDNNYIVNEKIPNVIGVKYKDGINNIWKPKWAREARGRFYYINGNDVIELKNSLQRGAEILTFNHVTKGISNTQDVKSKYIDMFDDTQQKIMNMFMEKEAPIKAILTTKVDGMLVVINIYSKNSKQYHIIHQLANEHSDEFNKAIINYCYNNNLDIVAISTNSTLFICPYKQTTFLTVIQNIINVSFDHNWLNQWIENCSSFVDIMLKYHKLNNINTDMTNYCFEFYCKDNITFDGIKQNELVCKYDDHGMILLGAVIDNKYYPHSCKDVLSDEIFKQPYYLVITNTKQVFDMMEKLNGVFEGSISEDQFFSNFSNYHNNNTIKKIDSEGFVLMTEIQDGVFDYEKIKTSEYYRCHKIKEDNVTNLLSLPRSYGNYFNILNVLHDFYDNISININNAMQEIYDNFEKEINFESPFFLEQNNDNKKRFTDYIDNPGDEDKKNTIIKIIANFKKKNILINDIIRKTTIKIFNCDADDFVNIIKKIFHDLKAWENNWQDKKVDKLQISKIYMFLHHYKEM